VVKDPKTAEALKPWYRQFCKRPCFHNEYLDTFNRTNVTLVDTSGKGVDRITPDGVVVGDTEYAVDCLIFATGFEVGTDYCRRAGMQIFGRDARSLSDYWAEGVRSLHGMHVDGYPNCFLMTNSQAGFTASFPHMLNEQARHLAWIVRRAKDEGFETVEASVDAVEGWVERCIEKAGAGVEFFENCTPGYYNNEGKLSERSVQNGFYGGGTGSPEFISILEAWRADGKLAGLVTRTRD
jgi:cation diffusion facilitator CzcD-associated flavoprotein CzcO